MKIVDQIKGTVVPMAISNIDTDAIIPKQFLKSIDRSGFGQYIFDAWRYKDEGDAGQSCTHRPKEEDFVLNQKAYAGATILVALDNFGCGSSREHAVWGLMDYGFEAIIAPSFADIFYSNALKNGLLPIVLEKAVVLSIIEAATIAPPYTVTVDLKSQMICLLDGSQHAFSIDSDDKERLLQGLDDIGLTLKEAETIKAYEKKRAQQEPWIFGIGLSQ